jgi:TolB protein
VPLDCIAAGGGPPRTLGVSTLVHADMADVAPKSGKLFAATRGAGRETWSEKQIALVNVETGAVRILTAKTVLAMSPSWSPDGRRIAYVAARDAGTLYPKAMAGVNIPLMRPDGTTVAEVVTPDMKMGPGGGEEAHVFLHQRRIWVPDPNTAGAPQQLTADARYRDEEPLWSSGGGHILFGRMD